jgi:hypothetical protein
MNFISKIIKPKDGEPELRQAHTGKELAARYDEGLKRWVFPGEVVPSCFLNLLLF